MYIYIYAYIYSYIYMHTYIYLDQYIFVHIYIQIYIYICICIYIYIYVYVYICMYTYICIYVYVNIHAAGSTNKSVVCSPHHLAADAILLRIQINNTHTHTHIHVYTYSYIYICTYVYNIYIYTYVYIYTYIQPAVRTNTQCAHRTASQQTPYSCAYLVSSSRAVSSPRATYAHSGRFFLFVKGPRRRPAQKNHWCCKVLLCGCVTVLQSVLAWLCFCL